jgi:signal transduction histidine kinase
VNDLAQRLHQAAEERALLMRKLVQVQDDERRGLARELHDEFGQSLTAAGALAASIELAAGKQRADIAKDANAIAQITREMMLTLRSALAKLRPPDLDELGLEASVRTMVNNWNRNLKGKTSVTLNVCGRRFSEAAPDVALSVYRIVQECLTNATRHGSPRHVNVGLISSGDTARDSLRVIVNDDGGGQGHDAENTTGYGLLGIRERVKLLGGEMTIMTDGRGMRVEAVIPATLVAAVPS